MAHVSRVHSFVDYGPVAAILARTDQCVRMCFERLERSHELKAISKDRCVISVESLARSFEALATAGANFRDPEGGSAEPQLLADAAPSVLALTDYDRAYVTTYLRLLDSVTENVPWEHAARVLLAIDPHVAPARAHQRYDSHLARARWIASQGYWDLLKGA